MFDSEEGCFRTSALLLEVSQVILVELLCLLLGLLQRLSLSACLEGSVLEISHGGVIEEREV